MSSHDVKDYIEFRVYLRDGIKFVPELVEVGEDLKDAITDALEPYAPIFTQDVSYTFHLKDD